MYTKLRGDSELGMHITISQIIWKLVVETLQQEDTVDGNSGVLIKWGPGRRLYMYYRILNDTQFQYQLVLISLTL